MNNLTDNNQVENKSLALSLEEAVRSEVVDLLYKALPASVTATLVAAISMVFVLWKEIESIYLIIWFLILTSISTLRFFVYRAYISKKNSRTIFFWDHTFYILLIFTSLTWSAVSIWLVPSVESTYHYMPALVLVGMTAGAVTLLGFKMLYISTYFIFLLTPFIISEIVAGTPLSYMVSFLLFIFVFLVIGTSKRFNLTMIENIRFRYYAESHKQDLIESKNAAIAANQVKDNFISMISHELRTPLNAILGFGQLLQMTEKPKLNEEQSENAQGVLDSGKHLLSLIEELLDLSKIDSHKLYMAMDNISLADNLTESISILNPVAAGFNIEITNNLENKYSVNADSKRLKQVFINLISNAIKYNHENGHVNISAKEMPAKKVRISVTDDGQGLTSEQQKNLFRPFQRYDDMKEGLGLGLYITKNLVELMEGSIGVESVYSEGSTFWFELKIS